jgi:pyruvate formate lyase activating enzyme
VKDAEEPKGLIWTLQRFAIHDGPGIRTLVYMKGCPLSCLWCSTPQTQKRSVELLHIELHCQRCGRCVEVCPEGAITLSEEEGVKIDRQLCTGSGQCVDACPNQARELVGERLTVEELFREVDKDRPFYRRSDGGVTVGGGEPTLQHGFVREFLRKCKQHYVHTAMETCGYVRRELLEELLEHLDLIYIDVKHMDAAAHQELTGVSNEPVLENVRMASALRPTIVRIPVVPGCNDSEENIAATAHFAAGLGEHFERIELLPYHQYGTQTYAQLGREYELSDVEPPDDARMERLRQIVESCGVKSQVGG